MNGFIIPTSQATLFTWPWVTDTDKEPGLQCCVISEIVYLHVLVTPARAGKESGLRYWN